jgi:HSP20 family protein
VILACKLSKGFFDLVGVRIAGHAQYGVVVLEFHDRGVIMLRSVYPQDMLAEFDRMQRQMQSMFDYSPSIRGLGRGGFPALNVGTTPTSVEIYAFEPGMDPNSIELSVERGVLTLSGERLSAVPEQDDTTTVHINERFQGRFKRVIGLPEDIDASTAQADYQDGVLHVSLQRNEASLPRRIDIH